MSDDRFGGYDVGREKLLLDAVWTYVTTADDREKNREEAAERRHRELVGKVDTVLGAFAAGFRAFADALDRANRR